MCSRFGEKVVLKMLLRKGLAADRSSPWIFTCNIYNLDQSKKTSVAILMHYQFPIIGHKGNISIEAMVEVFKAVFKSLLEVTWPAEFMRNLNNLPN